MRRILLSILLIALVSTRSEATHDPDTTDCSCPSDWLPDFPVDCADPAMPYACGMISGNPQCVASLPACPNGHIDCDTCTYVSNTPTPTNTPTNTQTFTITVTPTITLTRTITLTPTTTQTPTVTDTPTETVTPGGPPPTYPCDPCGPTPTPTPDEGLIYCFEEQTGSTTFDWSYHDHLGTLEGSPEPAWTSSGKYGGGLVFDGDDTHDQAVTFGPNDSLDSLSSGTVMAWINVTGADSGLSYSDVIIQGSNGTAYFQFLVYLTDSGTIWGLQAYSDNTGADYKDCYTTDTLTTGDGWHHVALTVTDTSTNAFYIDGVLAASTCDSPGVGFFAGAEAGTTQYAIGSDTFLDAQTFNGTIDDLRIYPTVLTEAQVAAAMASPGCPEVSGGGGGGTCTTQTLTRVDANTYSFPSGAPSTLEWCRVDLSDQLIVTTTPTQTQVQMTGGQLEIGWYLNSGAVVKCCGS